jgi:FkbM family methyltransferase
VDGGTFSAAARRAVQATLEVVAPPGSIRRHRLVHVVRRVRQVPAGNPLHQLVALFGETHPRAVFLQIGAHDTQQLDPLHHQVEKRRWRGILVEPIPYVFARLQQVWAGNDRLALENVAIGDHDGEATIFYLPQSADEHLPSWYDALASFRKDVVLKHRDYIPDIDDRIAQMTVPVLTFDSLCAKHSLGRVDVILIDTEGYDFEIIKQIDLDRYRPKIVIYESLHLAAADQEACLRLFRSHGYEAIVSPMDTFCLRPDALGPWDFRVRRLWSQLRAGGFDFFSPA